MATLKEQEELIEVLKFTPRTYKVLIYGYGGEIAMGRVSNETVKHFKDNFISVENYATNWADEGDDDYIEVPEDLQPFPQGSWYECDSIEHTSGAEFGGSTIQVLDENDNAVMEHDLDYGVLEDEGCEIEEFCCEDIDDYVSKESAVFVGQSFEKGTFFEGELELTQPFDPAKFKFTYSEVAGWRILNVVEYDGEEIDGSNGYSTTGKSSEFKFYYLDEDGSTESYDNPSDEDMGVPPSGPSPQDWEQSTKIKFSKQKPEHVGWYNVNWGGGNTYGTLYWDGENFVEFYYGKSTPVNQKGIVTWQGYNWDTSDWANRPPAPPESECKKCGWIGNQEDLNHEDDKGYTCPDCGSGYDKLMWIDYDPMTAKGRKNREKYCIDLNNMISVPKDDPIYADFEALMNGDSK